MELIDQRLVDRLKGLKLQLLAHLREPKKLLIVTLGVLALLGVGGVYHPLSSRIQDLEREIASEKQRHEYIADIDKLRSTLTLYRKHLPEKVDVNWWAKYLLTGIRESGMKLRTFEPREKRKVRLGRFRGLVLRIELEGRYENLLKFIAGLERNQTIVRITQIRLQKRPRGVSANLEIAVLTSRRKPNVH